MLPLREARLISRCVEGAVGPLSRKLMPMVELDLWRFGRLLLFRKPSASVLESSLVHFGRHLLLLGALLFLFPPPLPAVGFRAGTFPTVVLDKLHQFSPGFFFPADALLLQRPLRLRVPGGALQLALEALDDAPLHLRLDLLPVDQFIQLAELLLEFEELDHKFSMGHVVRRSVFVGPEVASRIAWAMHLLLTITVIGKYEGLLLRSFR